MLSLLTLRKIFSPTQILKMECAVSERVCSLSVEVVRHEPGHHFLGAEAVIPTVFSQE